MVNQKEFLERFTGAIEQEFTSKTGSPLPWAPGHPKQWASEKAAIHLGQETQSTPALSPDEMLLAVGVGEDVHIYKVATQERLKILKGHTAVVEGVQFSSQTYDGGYLLASHSGVALGDASSKVILWRLDNHGNSLFSEQPDKFDGQLGLWGSSAFSPDGKSLIFISQNVSTQFDEQDGISHDASSLPCINLWKVEGKITQHHLRGHTDKIQCVTISPDGKHLASAAWDGTTRIWDTTTGSCLDVLGPFDGGQLWSVGFSPNGSHVAISQESPNGRVHVCEVSTGKTVSTVNFHLWTRSVAWNPEGDMVACGADPGTVAVWNPYTGEEKMRWGLKFEDFGMGTMARPRAVRFLGKGKIVFQLNEGTVYAYDLEANRKYRFGRGPEDEQEKFPRAEMVCSERIFVIPDTEGVLRLWDF
jgi:WD40 repeat protein